MAINSRNKGCKAERTVAKLMEKWTSKQFARTPSSGGLNWKSANSKGDIVCTTEGHYFPFCIEVKHHAEINFSELYMPKKKKVKVLEFWEQCKRDALKANKIPLLFMRYNGLPNDFFFIGLYPAHKKSLGIILENGSTFDNLDLVIGISSDLFLNEYKLLKTAAKKLLNETKRVK
jgi:Holliday junction resolvase